MQQRQSTLPYPTTISLERHPKIKPELSGYRKCFNTPTLKTRKFRVFYSKTLEPFSASFESFSAIDKVLRLLKTPNKVSKIFFQNFRPKSSYNARLFCIMRRSPSISTLHLSFISEWGNMKLCQILFKSFAAFKNLKNAHLELMTDKIPDYQLKCIKRLRVFRNLSLSFRSYSDKSNYDLLSSNLGKLRQLRELNLEMLLMRMKTDRFFNKLACALSKLCTLKKFNLELSYGKVLQSSVITLFQSIQTLKFLSDIAINLGKSIIKPNKGSFAGCFQHLNNCPIQKLNLAIFADFTDVDIFHFSNFLKKLALLEVLHLNLQSENATDQGLIDFGSRLSRLNSLTSLSLKFSSSTKTFNPVQNIASALRPLQNLSQLKLNFDKLQTKNQQLHDLFENLRGLKSLTSFDLYTDKIAVTDKSLKVLEKSFQGLKSLQYLSLEFHSVRFTTDHGGMALASGIECLHAMKYLMVKLDSEKLTDQTLNKFSEIFKSLPSLCSVDLRFSGCEKMKNHEKLMKVLKEMKNINEVHLWLPYSDRREQILKDLDRRKFVEVLFALRTTYA